MAKFELKFKDESDECTIQVKNGMEMFSQKNCISIILHDVYSKQDYTINLDKSTAIKFAKTLRTEINKITESEEIK